MFNHRYDILDGLPAYGPMYVPVSEDGIPFYNEGYVVRFFKSDGTSWVANFKTGWTNFSGVFDFPNFKRTIVFASGNGYLMIDDQQEPLKVFGSDFITAYIAENKVLIAPGQTDIILIELDSDKVSNSDRIALDGIKNLNFNGDFITGLAYNHMSNGDDWNPFSFNYKTMEIISKSQRLIQYKKPWWKFW